MTRRLQDVGLVVLAAIAAVLIFLAFREAGSTPEAQPGSAAASVAGGAETSSALLSDTESPTTAAATADPAPVESALTAARAVLASEEPVVMSVLGDSTSNAPQEWVHRWAVELSTQRPVTISHWDEAGESGFVESDVLSKSGEGSALTIWSGSQSGADATHPVQSLALIVPETPNLVLLNFGHNETVEDAAPDFANLLAAIRQSFGDVPVVVVLQQPEVGDANVEVREEIRDWAQTEDLATIDVARAFLDTDDFAALLGDDIHPNDDGSRLWAQTVAAALDG